MKHHLNAKPFLKWAGGKKQLLLEFQKRLPVHLKDSKTIEKYVEPFVGGGAMFFFLKKHYCLDESLLLDINRELVMAYKTVKYDHIALIDILKEIEENHLEFDEEGRKKNYYNIRSLYNREVQDFDKPDYDEKWIARSGKFIFLNKTCYNGLFRQNKKGEFNVPFGLYKNPKICDEKNIKWVNKALRDTEILCADFTSSDSFINDESFVYLDPPYRPISKTSNFTNYSKNGFNDFDQVKLADYFKKMDQRGAYLMLSNSDPKNIDPSDEFFDSLYTDYNIDRIPAKRNINSNPTGRGDIYELIIRNYSI